MRTERQTNGKTRLHHNRAPLPAFKTSNAEMQSTNCNVIYSDLKHPINWIQFLAHIETRSIRQCSCITDQNLLYTSKHA